MWLKLYVAMLRVTSLSGLHLINIDPRSIKALDSAIIEYSQLRQKFCPSLSPLSTSKQRPKSVPDRRWCITKSSLTVQQKSISANLPAAFPNKGFSNTNGLSSYANSVMQCILNSDVMRAALLNRKQSSCATTLHKIGSDYSNSGHTPLNCDQLRAELGDPFTRSAEIDPQFFFDALMLYNTDLYSLATLSIAEEEKCNSCGYFIRRV